MSVTQTYHLAHLARGKLAHEAAQAEHRLHRLVGHANLLDSLMFDLQAAEEEQERWFNNTVKAAIAPAPISPTAATTEPRHIKWADQIRSAEREILDAEAVADESDVEDVDPEQDDDDLSSDEEDYDMDDDFVELVRVSSHKPEAPAPISLPSPPPSPPSLAANRKSTTVTEIELSSEEAEDITSESPPSSSSPPPPPASPVLPELDADESSEDEDEGRHAQVARTARAARESRRGAAATPGHRALLPAQAAQRRDAARRRCSGPSGRRLLLPHRTRPRGGCILSIVSIVLRGCRCGIDAGGLQKLGLSIAILLLFLLLHHQILSS